MNDAPGVLGNIEEIAAGLKPLPALAQYAEVIGVGVVVVALTYLSLVIGELVPKRLALTRSETIAGLVAVPMAWLAKLA